MDKDGRTQLRRHRTVRLVAPFVVGGFGIAMLIIALGQPAFVGSRIGPGLFAQVFAGGVVALAILTALVNGVGPLPSSDTARRMPLAPGICLLAAVVAFIVLRSLIGLAPTAAVVSVLASVGAGDRRFADLLLSAAVGGAVGWTIGTLLLPPTTALWPWSPHL